MLIHTYSLTHWTFTGLAQIGIFEPAELNSSWLFVHCYLLRTILDIITMRYS